MKDSWGYRLELQGMLMKVGGMKFIERYAEKAITSKDFLKV